MPTEVIVDNLTEALKLLASGLSNPGFKTKRNKRLMKKTVSEIKNGWR